MRKATRQFLKILSQVSDDAQVIKVLPVAIDYAKPNECFQNCMKFLNQNPDYYLRSGWLVGEYWGKRGTAIMPHYWVCDASAHSDYDVTPLPNEQTFEYFLDMNIFKNTSDELKIVIPASLKLNHNGELVVRIGVDKYCELDCFKYDELFKLAASAED